MSSIGIPSDYFSSPDFCFGSLSRRGGCQNQKRPRFPLLVPPSPPPQFPSVVGAVIKCSLGPSLAPRTSLARIATRTNVREGEGGKAEGGSGRKAASVARQNDFNLGSLNKGGGIGGAPVPPPQSSRLLPGWHLHLGLLSVMLLFGSRGED